MTEQQSTRRTGNRLQPTETALGSVLLSVDFLLGSVIGAGAGAAVVFSKSAAKMAPTVLGTSAGICAGILALALAAAGFVGFLTDSNYLRLMEQLPGGVRGLRAPFIVVAIVSAVGVISNLAVMLVWSTLGATPGVARGAAFGVPSGLLVWSLVGAVQLVSQGMYHAARRAELAGLIDQAERRRPPRKTASGEAREARSAS